MPEGLKANAGFLNPRPCPASNHTNLTGKPAPDDTVVSIYGYKIRVLYRRVQSVESEILDHGLRGLRSLQVCYLTPGIYSLFSLDIVHLSWCVNVFL